MKQQSSRRQFLGAAAVLVSGTLAGAHKVIAAPSIIRNLRRTGSFINGVQIGVITYSFRDQQYSFPATIELEYTVPEGSNPIAEVKKCLAFCQAALA
jgi:hypothetical protein